MRSRWTVSVLGVAAVAGLAVVGMVVTGCRAATRTSSAEKKAIKYHCPMHPTYIADKPGDCPICGMRLVPMPESPAPETPAAAPGEHRHGSGPSAAGEGRATVTLTPERRRLLGVRTESVAVASLDRTFRTVGRVTVDERRIQHVHTKFDGFIERLYVDYTGKEVRKGQPLVSIYSPDLVATQQEYLLAVRAQKQLGASGVPSVARGGMDLLQAARQRLLLWDIRPADIDRLERTGEVQRTLDLHSSAQGIVVEKTAQQGMRVTPADTLFDIADLSRLWVMADVYEQDLASVRLGMTAEVTVSYLPGRTWHGTVTYVAPMVEEKTRTVKVRVEVPNPDGELRPEMFADVVLRAPGGTGLVVPEGAVIRSGERNLVFVERADGTLQPVEVRLGGKVGSGFQVLSGLSEGDRVVTSANFLLDSESSLKAALSAISPPPPGPPGGPASAPAGEHRH